MRGARWLLLIAIAAILAGVGVNYTVSKRLWKERSPAKPDPLPPNTSAYAPEWCLNKVDGDRKVAEVCAEYSQRRDSSTLDLKNVDLKLYHKDGRSYDLVKSGAAFFSESDSGMFSEGDVEITLGVPAEGRPSGNLVSIKTSGLRLDVVTGKAETDRPASFVFRNGSGKSTGAFYDPVARELVMKADVELNWEAPEPGSKPTKIEAGSLTYREVAAEILLLPWGRITRGGSVMEGQESTVALAKGADGGTASRIRHVHAKAARGSETYPGRKLNYSAGELWVDFDDQGVVQRITGRSGADLASNSKTSDLQVRSDIVELIFMNGGGDSVLDFVAANGNAALTVKPVAAQGRQPGETRVMKSQQLELKMRPGGQEIASVISPVPGTLEFFPNAPSQHHRTLDGKTLRIEYGRDNAIEAFRATGAKTQTDPTEEERKRNRKLAITTSRELLARFEPATSRLLQMEQTGDFTYDEGDRRARSVKATLDSTRSTILLQGSARMWDSTGSTSADSISMDQATGDFTAEGGVNSSRLPDKSQKSNSGMLTGDQPLQAQARKMRSTNRNNSMRYEGNAVMWQGANRIQADVITLDREKRTLDAAGNVLSNLWEQPKSSAVSGQQKAASTPVLTAVRAQRLVYTESDRLARYTGGVTLQRGGLNVQSAELRAYMSGSADSQLDKGIADGAVQIVQAVSGRKRTGTGDHAEFYAADQRIILRGANARLVDSVKGSSEGAELTYFANDDRLLVSGTPGDPVKSRINRSRP